MFNLSFTRRDVGDIFPIIPSLVPDCANILKYHFHRKGEFWVYVFEQLPIIESENYSPL